MEIECGTTQSLEAAATETSFRYSALVHPSLLPMSKGSSAHVFIAFAIFGHVLEYRNSASHSLENIALSRAGVMTKNLIGTGKVGR